MKQDELLSVAMLLLREAGIRITGGNLDALSLMLPDRDVTEVKVQVSPTPPTPSRLSSYADRGTRTLVVTGRATPALREAASAGTVDLVATESPLVIVAGDTHLEKKDEASGRSAKQRGRTPWGLWAITRALALSDHPYTQQQLAEASGISQPAVNRHLNSSALTWVVERGAEGWKARDTSSLVSWLAEHYPGPKGVSTYWYSLKTPGEQAKAAVAYAADMGASPLVSGDAAADIYAPWRLPDSVHLYLREMVDFTDAGFTPSSREEATLIATVPEDPTLWSTACLTQGHNDLPLADPVVILLDVIAADVADSAEAAEHLREAIVGGAAW